MGDFQEETTVRVAITYHYSLSFGGSERVLEVLAGMYPEAEFFTLMVDEKFLPDALKGRKITTSFLNRIPGAKRIYRHLMPLYPIAVAMMDMSGFDLVISADGAPTKGVMTDQEAVHLCYCHSPARSFWDQYQKNVQSMQGPMRLLFVLVAGLMRMWDTLAAQRVDGFVANSHYVANRIHKYYRRSSTVIHPPVDMRGSFLSERREDYYLSVGRLVPEKRVDLAIAACNRLGRRLRVVGTGPEEERLRAMAGPTIEFLGRVEDERLRHEYASCRALLFTADEDFGLVPIEAQSFGRPVIAYGHGGALETVVGLGRGGEWYEGADGAAPTGLFFRAQTEASVELAIREFECVEARFDPVEIRRHASRFDTAVFVEKMRSYVDSYVEHRRRSRQGAELERALEAEQRPGFGAESVWTMPAPMEH